jgi:hypothetical protein
VTRWRPRQSHPSGTAIYTYVRRRVDALDSLTHSPNQAARTTTAMAGRYLAIHRTGRVWHFHPEKVECLSV